MEKKGKNFDRKISWRKLRRLTDCEVEVEVEVGFTGYGGGFGPAGRSGLTYAGHGFPPGSLPGGNVSQMMVESKRR